MNEQLIQDINKKSIIISDLFISICKKESGNFPQHNPFNDYGMIDFKENILVLGLMEKPVPLTTIGRSKLTSSVWC